MPHALRVSHPRGHALHDRPRPRPRPRLHLRPRPRLRRLYARLQHSFQLLLLRLHDLRAPRHHLHRLPLRAQHAPLRFLDHHDPHVLRALLRHDRDFLADPEQQIANLRHD